MRSCGTLLALAVACGHPDPTSPTPGPNEPPTADTGPAPTALGDFHTLRARLHPEVGSLFYAGWTQEVQATVHVEFTFGDEGWRSTPSRTLGPGTWEQLVIGVPFESFAEWRLVDEGTGATFAAGLTRTEDYPEGLPVPVVTASVPEAWQPGADYLLTSINERDGGWTTGDYWAIVLDRQGRLLWALRTPGNHWTLFVTVARAGDHLLVDESTYWAGDFGGGGAEGQIHRRYLDAPIESVAAPGLHHEFVELPDGTLVWGSQFHGGHESLVSKAPGQIDETVIWSCDEDWPGSGACESNGLFYVEATDSFLYSFYTNNSLVEVDHQTGESLWWAGDVPGGYTFAPQGSEFRWQHGVSYTEAGTLLLSSEQGIPPNELTWLMEYVVDRKSGTLEYVWGDSSEVHALTNGQAWRLEGGNTLHVVGSAGVVREVDPTGVDVWRVDFRDDHLLGNGHFLGDLYALVAPVSP